LNDRYKKLNQNSIVTFETKQKFKIIKNESRKTRNVRQTGGRQQRAIFFRLKRPIRQQHQQHSKQQSTPAELDSKLEPKRHQSLFFSQLKKLQNQANNQAATSTRRSYNQHSKFKQA
jgi:hypothetical protein